MDAILGTCYTNPCFKLLTTTSPCYNVFVTLNTVLLIISIIGLSFFVCSLEYNASKRQHIVLFILFRCYCDLFCFE
jgi:hypothetical protein